MSVKFVSYENVDSFVEKQKSHGMKCYWDGWTLKVFAAHPRARTDRHGRFFEGEWGFFKSISPTMKGKWVFDRNLLAHNGR